MLCLNPAEARRLLRIKTVAPHMPLTDLPVAERTERLARARGDLAYFMDTYLPHYVKNPSAGHHNQIAQFLTVKNRPLAIIAPRGAGKGTIFMGYTMQQAVFGLQLFILRIEATIKIAANECQKLAHEFMENPRILQDFGDLRGDTWQAEELLLNNGVKLWFRSVRQPFRGVVHYEHRFSMILLNDVESLQSVRSVNRTQHVLDIVMKDAAPAGNAPNLGGLVYGIIGTYIGQTCALKRLAEMPLTKAMKIPAFEGSLTIITQLMDTISECAEEFADFYTQMEQHGKDVTPAAMAAFVTGHPRLGPLAAQVRSYWEAQFPLAWLIFEAAKDTASFWQEFLHFPLPSTAQKFHIEWFVPYAELPEKRAHFRYAIAIDPSARAHEASDLMCVLMGALDPNTKKIYILHAWMHHATVTEMVEHVFYVIHAHEAELGKTTANRALPIYVEANQAQIYAIDVFTAIRDVHLARGEDPNYWRKLRVVPITNILNKLDRISSLLPVGEQHRIHYRRGHSQQDLLITQTINFRGEHAHGDVEDELKIDGPDTLELLYRALTEFGRGGAWVEAEKEEGRRRDAPVSVERRFSL